MKYWLSNKKFTIYVETDQNNVITDTAPITKTFKGQPFDNLRRWCEFRFGKTKVKELT